MPKHRPKGGGESLTDQPSRKKWQAQRALGGAVQDTVPRGVGRPVRLRGE